MTETNSTAERWIPVVGFEGFYEVSDLGRVRSLDRTVQTSRGSRRLRGRVLKAITSTLGYPQVGLHREGVHQTSTIHSLVITAFVGPRPVGQETRHLNGDRNDSRLANLVYGTHQENCLDKIRHGTSVKNTDECPQGHPYSGPNLSTKRGHRECKLCKVLRQRKSRAKAKQLAAAKSTSAQTN